MKRDKGAIIFSPADLIKFMSSPFVTWMDLRYLDDKTLVPDVQDESTRILQLKGIDHERKFLEDRKTEGQSVRELDGQDDSFELTLESMRAGHDVIYQAQLKHGNFSGLSDFLFRRPGDSLLGDYHYEVWDTKLAKKPKPYFVIQLCCYAEMLEAIQGRMPETVGIALGGGTNKTFRTDDYFFFYKQLKQSFLDFVSRFDPNQEPCDVEVVDFSRWNTFAEKLLEERDDLSRVANIRRVQIERLKQNNITTMDDLAKTEFQILPKVRQESLATLKQQARLQKASVGRPRPVYELLKQCPDDPRRGFAMLPPTDRHDIYFDMEGYPHMEGGLEYLFGVTYLNDSGHADFIDWWAHDRDEERVAFEKFIDWVHARWKKHPAMHVYHYANYEVAAMRRLMGRHGTRESEVDDLLRNEVFVDLYMVVRQAMCVGEPSYSIKKIEHLYRDKREGGVSTATDSIVFYERWLEEQDGSDWNSSTILKDIRDYNKVDCDSTMELCDWLRLRQSEAGISYLPKLTDDDDGGEKKASTSPELAERAMLAAELLAEVEAGKITDTGQMHLQQLLAWLLMFHKRERKPVLWAMFDRHAMTQDELIDDLDCLGGLARTKTPKLVKENPRSKPSLYEYEFDPGQDTKLSTGSKCFLSHDLKQRAVIDSLDHDNGKVVIQLSEKCPEPPTIIGLIPDDHVPTASLETAIFSIVRRWRDTGHLPPAIVDFLGKRRPRVHGIVPGDALVDERLDLTQETHRVVSNLDSTTLCIQGPPGCGKTSKAARVIAALIKAGKRVGVTSNSHKAIENLMAKVAEVAHESGIGLVGAKIGGEDAELPFGTIKHFDDKKKVFPNKSFNFIGGTAFAFCIGEAEDSVDYLFVDEAGQVSIANLVAVSRCAKNIILLGDQMQLEQPIQGSHPGDSGESTLQYYIDGHATIPQDRGIFFGVTYRMHPDLCAIISGAVYEGRLHPDACTARRQLQLPQSKLQLLCKKAGVQFIPVEHEGNTQGSSEEVESIKGLVKELLSCSVIDSKGNPRPLRMEDILIVAPYNLQVRNLKQALPSAKIGSVDKFQGQEAPVVILSMCASEGNSSPRGLSFLFNLNRLNVALSRAQTLAIVVGSPRLVSTESSTVDQMKLVNFYCRIVQSGSPQLVRA